jgi:hypothetical protein
MADQLAVWNIALSHLGSRRLAALNEAREPARVLADEWDQAVRWCLELSTWQFATRLDQVLPTGDAPPVAYAHTFLKPSGWIRTVDLSTDIKLVGSLTNYVEEGSCWFADPAAIYVRYVSADPIYGFDTTRWPSSFVDLVALRLAERCCRRITGSSEMLGDLVKLRSEAEKQALTVEEQNAARNFPIGALNQLQVYNDALAYLGRARVVSLTQTNDTVRELNDQWTQTVLWALLQAPWQFAVRADIIATTPQAVAVEGFGRPAGCVKTVGGLG